MKQEFDYLARSVIDKSVLGDPLRLGNHLKYIHHKRYKMQIN